MRRVTIVIILAMWGLASTGEAQTIEVNLDARGIPAAVPIDATSYSADTAPPAPTRLSVTSSGGQVSLSWTAAVGASSYNIKRGTSSGAETLVATGVAGASYVDGAVASGPRYFYLVSASNESAEGPDSNEASISLKVTAPADVDGDGKSDLVIYRPSTLTFWALKSGGNFSSYSGLTVGSSLGGDVPEPGDYDGDHILDFAVNEPQLNYRWLIPLSSTEVNGVIHGVQHDWGSTGDVPVPADYDGDGKTDIAVYRPSTGWWFVLKSSSDFATYSSFGWGLPGDVPVAGDYDGDGKADPAIYRPSTGQWWILESSTNYVTSRNYGWGLGGDVPVAADYDGDGKTDVAVFRPSTAGWWILKSSTGFASYVNYGWGLNGDVPVLGDYDGDGKTDIAVFRPTTGGWWILKSSTNFATYITYSWGATGDISLVHRP